jgi:hypothetical protein
MMHRRSLMRAAGGPLDIADVFSTDLYTGNGSTQTITNGIDLSGEGGLTWIKTRSSSGSHFLFDTERGIEASLSTNNTNAEFSPYNNSLTSYNSDGFSLGSAGGVNGSGNTYAAWTFRKAPKFFDVVTYTGDGVSGRTVAHDLGCEVGAIFVKNTSSASDWAGMVRASSTTFASFISLNLTDGAGFTGTLGNMPTTTDFTTNSLGNSAGTIAPNVNGENYVAYLFAHDTDPDEGLIQCGSSTCDGSGFASVDLGWEPQFVMVKRTNGAGSWFMSDTMRGMPATGSDTSQKLAADESSAEATTTNRYTNINATGFNQALTGDAEFIYMAIRGPMMKEPESADEVFAMDGMSNSNPTFTSGFPVDMSIYRDGSTADWNKIQSRLTASSYLRTNGNNVKSTVAQNFDYSNGWSPEFIGNYPVVKSWMWKRAKGYFDVVAYTGDGTTDSQRLHSLGVAPEMIWVKVRSQVGNWIVGHSGLTPLPFNELILNTNGDVGSVDNNNEVSKATDTYITVNSNSNLPSQTYIAYLFATLAGISKVGSYTGNGSSQTLDCGFTSGARFILIKRADVDGDWYLWDTERGIVSGNDTHISLNALSVEVTTDDSVDPASSGFIVNQVAATNINVSAATYIFYAIA